MPAETPVSVPSVPIRAWPVLLLLHVPPAVWSLSVVVSVAQTRGSPEIGCGSGLTVTSVVMRQDVGKV